MRGALCLIFLLIAPLARADQPADTADLIGILRALYAERCGVTNWRFYNYPQVITDRASAPLVNQKTKRPWRMYDLDLVPRAPPGTLWPQVTLCPGIGVVDHNRLERLVERQGGLPSYFDAFEFAYGGNGSYDTITLPAFSATGNRAVVFREHVCGLCGDGTYFELIRTRWGWKITRKETIWRS